MDLYLIPNNLDQTVLCSATGTPHYTIKTVPSDRGTHVTNIRNVLDSSTNPFVADIEWRTATTPTMIHSPLLCGIGEDEDVKMGVRAIHVLQKRKPFSLSRYFIGHDMHEYRWKPLKDRSCLLTCLPSSKEVARLITITNPEGAFAGGTHSVLRIQPSGLDVDLIVVTFVFMEKKRRDRDGVVDHVGISDHDLQSEESSDDDSEGIGKLGKKF